MAEVLDGELLGALPVEGGAVEGEGAAVVQFVFDAAAHEEPDQGDLALHLKPGERRNLAEEKEKKIAQDVGAAYELIWPPKGYYQCRLCQTWLLLFPDNGERVTRSYAVQHCTQRHLTRPTYRCLSSWCHHYTTNSRKAIRTHQLRRVCHNNLMRPGFERILTVKDEREAVDDLIDKCWPHVALPLPRWKLAAK